MSSPPPSPPASAAPNLPDTHPFPHPSPASHLTSLHISAHHLFHSIHLLRDYYAHFHAQLHAQDARLRTFDQLSGTMDERAYRCKRDQFAHQREVVTKRMRGQREGWGKCMKKLGEVRREIREVVKVVGKERAGEIEREVAEQMRKG